VIPLTADAVMLIAGADRAHAERYLPFLQGTCKAYSITSPRRIVGFLSQIGVESDGLTQLVESLNYSVDGLLNTFGRHRISAEDANRYGRVKGRAANQEAIANRVYGGKFGREKLGNTEPGDGWKYRGRGLKQLTGRWNCMACGKALGEDFVNDPDRLLLPVNAALSAGWFWSTNGLNAIADTGDVLAMTRKVNGGVNGLERRIALWEGGQRAFA
jgi:putative chitinase